jgi:suppressor for copper-sensitivity B
MNHKGRGWLKIAVLALLALPRPALAADPAASDWFVTDQGRVRLIAAEPGTGQEASLTLGLEFRLAPHWKIYWRSPGDAGYPPRLDWSGSANLAEARMAWPAPQRFSVLDLETVGYTDNVVFPITARLAQPGAPLHLQLALSYLTCSDICVPYDTVLRLDLPAGLPPGGGGYAALIARYAARVPDTEAGAGLKLNAATLLPGRKPLLELHVDARPPLQAPDAFIEGGDGVAFGAPRLSTSQTPGEAVLRLPIFGKPAAINALIGRKLTLTLVDGERAIEAPLAPVLGPPQSDLGLLLGVLPLALLGGFILNFMPCVLPVLSIKLLGVVEQGGRAQRALRFGFLASAAGVILAFLALAASLVALKDAGYAIGWGVQFQQPLFLIFMVALLTLFAANLWGLFEVPLPRALAFLGARGGGPSLLGNLAAGAFATLLATPCSAPFLGTAVGFALAAGPAEIFAIFLALGIGLGAPYLLVALLPRLALRLPRPGRWTLTLRRVLGAALALTALWLVSVLVTQIGAVAALAVGGLMLAALLALLLRPAGLRRPAVAVLLLAAFFVPASLGAPPTIEAADGLWRPFDAARIGELVRDGHVVFVDVTADWCLTCKVNKELVIDQPAIRRRLEAPDVVAMRADWTRPDAVIAAYLRSFGRYGIPFNAVYGPGAPHGLALSEILTVDRLAAALVEAAGPGKVAGTAR